MGVIFIQQEADTGWLPTDVGRKEFEDFLEGKVDHKVVFLPQGCVPQVREVGDETLILIEQNSRIANVSGEAREIITKEIYEKIGKRAFFLPPACSLQYFSLRTLDEDRTP